MFFNGIMQCLTVLDPISKVVDDIMNDIVAHFDLPNHKRLVVFTVKASIPNATPINALPKYNRI